MWKGRGNVGCFGIRMLRAPSAVPSSRSGEMRPAGTRCSPPASRPPSSPPRPARNQFRSQASPSRLGIGRAGPCTASPRSALYPDWRRGVARRGAGWPGRALFVVPWWCRDGVYYTHRVVYGLVLAYPCVYVQAGQARRAGRPVGPGEGAAR